MVNEPTFSGCLIESGILGLFRMKEREANDLKVLVVPDSDPLFDGSLDLANFPGYFGARWCCGSASLVFMILPPF